MQRNNSLRLIVGCLVLACFLGDSHAGETHEADIVIYGLTSAGIAAGVLAARMRKSVILVGPETHLGGLTSGGLGWTDSGKKEAVGGFAREYYRRIKNHYDRPEA